MSDDVDDSGDIEAQVLSSQLIDQPTPLFWPHHRRFLALFQEEELEALEAIFGSDVLRRERSADGTATVEVRVRDDAILQLLLPKGYPSRQAPLYQFSEPWASAADTQTVSAALDAAFEPVSYVQKSFTSSRLHILQGMPVLFTWAELWKDHLALHHPVVEQPAAPAIEPQEQRDDDLEATGAAIASVSLLEEDEPGRNPSDQGSSGRKEEHWHAENLTLLPSSFWYSPHR